MKTMKRIRAKSGATVMEFGAVLMLGLPLLLLLVYFAIELTQYFTIKAAMDVGARNAARALVVDFNNNRTCKTSIDLATWTFLKMPNYIVNNGQFDVVWDSTTTPSQVTVSCQYSGPGLTPFPSGPLNYLNNNASLNLSGIRPTGQSVMPVQ
jgi:Flp pilus assembly protein TadG